MGRRRGGGRRGYHNAIALLSHSRRASWCITTRARNAVWRPQLLALRDPSALIMGRRPSCAQSATACPAKATTPRAPDRLFYTESPYKSVKRSIGNVFGRTKGSSVPSAWLGPAQHSGWNVTGLWSVHWNIPQVVSVQQFAAHDGCRKSQVFRESNSVCVTDFADAGYTGAPGRTP